MKNLLRLCAVAVVVLVLAGMARAQEGSTRAEFECLALANSSRVALPGEASPYLAYHHVWTPGLGYGTFQSNGLTLVYETQGTSDEVVIVVHGGAGLPHEYFHPMLYNLSRYAKLVYFDRRADMMSARQGHGMASVDEMADDLDALRQSLGLDKVTVLGHSFGANIALNYAVRHPEHVKRLILVSASASVENPSEAEKRILKQLSANEMAAYRSSEDGTGGAKPCDRVRARYAVLYPHYFHKLVPYDSDRGVYTAYFDALAKKQALASDGRSLEVSRQLDAIKAPVLVVAGRHDLVTLPDRSKELAAGLSQSRLVLMEHSGHFPFFEENYLFTEWVRNFMAATSDQHDDRATPGPTADSSGGSH
ncbi:MAG TPA: alpha/beta hydrolase [Blastocatellia bacterium]|nr:alpha/beta hydrolase [Blastocatellia bacterium]